MSVRIVKVPKVPSSAFNKNRRASDLVQQQVTHFQHVLARRASSTALVREAKRVKTEGQAARFIAKATTLLHPQSPSLGRVRAPAKTAATGKTATSQRAKSGPRAPKFTRRKVKQ